MENCSEQARVLQETANDRNCADRMRNFEDNLGKGKTLLRQNEFFH